MRYTPIEPPRTFEVGVGGGIEMKDCARIELAPDEQVTFVTPSGGEYDVARKDFGFYATPSLNGRLRDFGLGAALVRNAAGRDFILLVERTHEPAFHAYLAREHQTLLTWLDNGDIPHFAPSENGPATPKNPVSTPRNGDTPHFRGQKRPSRGQECGSETRNVPIFEFSEPPVGETRYPSVGGRAYRRKLVRCEECGHFQSECAVPLEELYRGEYVSATYRDAQGVKAAFDRVMALPPGKSDNAGRVVRVNELVDRYAATAPGAQRRLLDVGSGLCVFAARMKNEGWTCTVVDPDPRAAAHARDVVGIEAIEADFNEIEPPGSFDLVTFNKVLEHVEDPAVMLARAARFLAPAPGSLVYIEVPDGPAAFADPAGPMREEFFIEHRHVFSVASTDMMAQAAGFQTILVERLREPSGKYTIRALLRPAGAEVPSR